MIWPQFLIRRGQQAVRPELSRFINDVMNSEATAAHHAVAARVAAPARIGHRVHHLARLLAQAGPDGTRAARLTVRVRHDSPGRSGEPFARDTVPPAPLCRRLPGINARSAA
jgi:hypothetical protein